MPKRKLTGIAKLGHQFASFDDALYSNPGQIPLWLLCFIAVIMGLVMSKSKTKDSDGNETEMGLGLSMLISFIIVFIGYASLLFQSGQINYRCAKIKGKAARRACRMNAIKQNQMMAAIRRR